MRCLPLNITNIYFILREWVHQLQRPGTGRYRSGESRKSIVGTPASVHGSKAVGVACLESMNWVRVTGAGQFYLSHIGGCAPDRVIWLATLFHSIIRGEIIMYTIGGSVRRGTGGNRHDTPLAVVSRARNDSRSVSTTATDDANSDVSSKEGAILSQPISTRQWNLERLFHWLLVTK
jgi:hypothetical protein